MRAYVFDHFYCDHQYDGYLFLYFLLYDVYDDRDDLLYFLHYGVRDGLFHQGDEDYVFLKLN